MKLCIRNIITLIIASFISFTANADMSHPASSNFSDVFATTTDRYQYSGKELDRMNGLDLYDFHARQYDTVLGRFTTPDPLSEKYYHQSPYAYCANNPANYIDLKGKDGVKVVDSLSKEILIRANYYVQTDEKVSSVSESMKIQEYSESEITKMQIETNEYLNGLNLQVTEGDFKDYNVKFELLFFPSSQYDFIENLNSAKYNNHKIGNTLSKWDKTFKRFVPFEGDDGLVYIVGGVTDSNRDIVMNCEYDNFMNRLHEIFHTLGLTHPKGQGAPNGIMAYPPETPNVNDINTLINSSFLPLIKNEKKYTNFSYLCYICWLQYK